MGLIPLSQVPGSLQVVIISDGRCEGEGHTITAEHPLPILGQVADCGVFAIIDRQLACTKVDANELDRYVFWNVGCSVSRNTISQ
jgi:hypothetical protein